MKRMTRKELKIKGFTTYHKASVKTMSKWRKRKYRRRIYLPVNSPKLDHQGVRCSFFRNFTTGYTQNGRDWIELRNPIFSQNIDTLYITGKWWLLHRHRLESWLKDVYEWVSVYYLGNHSFDRVCFIIKTTEFCS